jgi:hypothetical protein
MENSFELIREEVKPPPIKEVVVHLSPSSVEIISELLNERYEHLIDSPQSLTYAFNQMIKAVRLARG